MFHLLLLGNKPTRLENMRSYFLSSVLITQNKSQLSQSLLNDVPSAASRQ
ncbi:hypothetical protein HMPREF1366_01291 [Enterococcus faecium ERV26]|nr:hypothetical protein HMPREF1377_01876 [Enterococcus faecium R494]EJX59059.1 hypothetical protein HMPREF1376_02686 [Enterococcus faecium R446]EJX94119.1 hypothetical protein HMPREF1366_01291 [Enterococcus faecium ERV26]